MFLHVIPSFSVLYIFIISFSTSVLFSKRRINVNLVDLIKSCPNFHFSVSPHVPFLNLLFEQIANSNEYFLAKFGVDTEENEPSKVR